MSKAPTININPLRTIVSTKNKQITNERMNLVHPCKYELEILERCVDCGNNELKHVRICEKLGKCTRGDIRRNDIQSCSTCTQYVSPYTEGTV